MSIPSLPRFHTLTLLHNPACSKSRAALSLLKERAPYAHPPFTIDVVDYMRTPLTVDQLRCVTAYLVSGGHDANLGKMLRDEPAMHAAIGSAPSSEQVVAALRDHPEWMQRPIAVDWVRGRAVIGRPPEAVLELVEGVGEDAS